MTRRDNPLAAYQPHSIVTLADGRQAHYLGPMPEGTAQIVVEGTVLEVAAGEIAGVLKAPRDLALEFMAHQQPAKVVTLLPTEDGHVATVQVGPNPAVIETVEAPTAEEALAALIERVGLVEVLSAEPT